MKARVKLKDIEYNVEFSLRPFVINNIDKECDPKIKNKINNLVQKYIVTKYGSQTTEFYVKAKQKFINYINQNKIIRMTTVFDYFNLPNDSKEKEVLYKMAITFKKNGYLEPVQRGKYKLIKEIPNLQYARNKMMNS